MISYKIRSREPVEIKQYGLGTRGLCGATYLDQGFESLLRQRLTRSGNLNVSEGSISRTLGSFEHIKQEFNPYEAECEMEYEIAIPGAPDVPEIGLEEGYLMLSR